MIGSTIGQCIDSFAPCVCEYDSSTMFYPWVTCNQVPVATVKTIFSKIKSNDYLEKLIITPNRNDTKIISNILGNRVTTGNLNLGCPTRSIPLVIDPAAFSNATKEVTSVLTILNCELNKLNWAFLSGFNNLVSINVLSCSNFHSTFSTFPSASLTRLTSLYLKSIIELDGFSSSTIRFPPPLPNGLESLYIGYCYNFGSVALGNLLTKWVTPTSQDTMLLLAVTGNNLTQIPPDVSKFKSLAFVEFYENMQPLKLSKGAFNFSTPVQAIYMDYSKIAFVPTGAYSGKLDLFKVILLP